MARVVIGLSGGVDSSVAAVLLHTDPALTWWAFPIAEGVCLILALLLFRSAYRKRIAPLGA